MGVELRRPEERSCERCGRREEWVEAGWRVVAAGEPFCVHEWDINGAFVPLRRVEGDEDGETSA